MGGRSGAQRLPRSTAEAAPVAWALQWVLLVAAVPYYAWCCVTGGGERRTLGLWIVGTTVLFALQDVWFPRQGYSLAAPIALLAALLAHVISVFYYW